jgi:CheY-like chemotaxis protein
MPRRTLITAGLGTVLDRLPLCAFLKDADGRYLAVNRALCEWLERDEGDLLGRTDYDLWPAELACRSDDDDRRALAGERVEREESLPRGTRPVVVRWLRLTTREPLNGTTQLFGLFWEVAGRGAAPVPDGPVLLIAESDEHVRTVEQAVLRRGGYETLTAADGGAAVEALRVEQRRLAGVVLDWGLPGSGVVGVLRELARLAPDVPVVLTSATGDARPGERHAHLVRTILAKPFGPEQLLRAVAAALAAVPAAAAADMVVL